MNLTYGFVCTLISFTCFVAGGCSKSTQTPSSPANGNAGTATSTSSPAPAAPRVPGGDPIDTSKLDADVAQAETEYKDKSGDDGSRVALAHAYLARAGALTKARQYRSALGDYRRTLKYEPANKDAQEMTTTIIGIFKQMGREAPAEGQEPPPLPFNKGTSATESSSPQKSY